MCCAISASGDGSAASLPSGRIPTIRPSAFSLTRIMVATGLRDSLRSAKRLRTPAIVHWLTGYRPSGPMDTRPLAYDDRTAEARGQTVMAAVRWASLSFEPEPQRGDAEERKEPDDIRHRRYKHPRRDRRIGVETMEHERHQNAAERPCPGDCRSWRGRSPGRDRAP